MALSRKAVKAAAREMALFGLGTGPACMEARVARQVPPALAQPNWKLHMDSGAESGLVWAAGWACIQ